MKKKKTYDILFGVFKFLVTTAVIGFVIHSIKKYENSQEVKIETAGVPKFETREFQNSLKYYFVSEPNDVDLCFGGNTNYLSTLYQSSFSTEHKERKGTPETTLDLLRKIASKTTFRDENIKSEKD